MKIVNFCIAIASIAAASCSDSKKDNAPVQVESNQTLTGNDPSEPQQDPNQPLFSDPVYLDAVANLKEWGCNIDLTTGVTACPTATSLDEADSLYVLLAKIREGIDFGYLAIKDSALKAIVEKSTDIELEKAKNSSYLKPLQEDIEQQRGEFKVACAFSFETTLGFQNRLAGIPVMRDLCADPAFLEEIARLKVGIKYGGLTVAEKNKFSFVTTWTRLRIGFSSTKAEVMEFLSTQKI